MMVFTFGVIAEVRPPQAPGPYRHDDFADRPTGTGIEWGLHIGLRSRPLPFLERFTCKDLADDWHLPR